MFFGKLKTKQAEGAILAHSLSANGHKLKKGVVLGRADLDLLQSSGFEEIMAARLEDGDVHEDEAATTLGAAMGGEGLLAREAFTGRVNIFARQNGLLTYDAHALQSLNLVDEGITVAFVKPKTRVRQSQMIGTIKIIPYAIEGGALKRAAEMAKAVQPKLHPFAPSQASLIMTTTSDMKSSLIHKGEEAVRARLTPLGISLEDVTNVPHDEAEIAASLEKTQAPLVLILTASATSDRRDAAPAGVVRAGGKITRYGIPVDPGNLLFTGQISSRQVVGLPGCVRSPVLNGTDFVLERIAAGLEISDEEFASMGAGGFLKEAPTRPQPRLQGGEEKDGIAVAILASGASSRMKGRDKLLEQVKGQPLLSHLINESKRSQADAVFVVLPQNGFLERREAAKGAQVIENPHPEEGMGASLRLAAAKLGPDYEAMVVLLADMPEIEARHIDKLIAAYSPEDGREICRAAAKNGEAGHPVLFGHRFFEPLMHVAGDQGAKALIAGATSHLELVRMNDDAPLIDLDTVEAWKLWRAKEGNS